MHHTKQWKRRECLTVHKDLLVMSLIAGRGWTCNINNEPNIFSTFFWTRMYKNYLIVLKHCLVLRFHKITFLLPHSYLNLAKQFILVTRNQIREKDNKVIRLRRAIEKDLEGRIRPTGRCFGGPDLHCSCLAHTFLL